VGWPPPVANSRRVASGDLLPAKAKRVRWIEGGRFRISIALKNPHFPLKNEH
jgi:hypothetical protein